MVKSVAVLGSVCSILLGCYAVRILMFRGRKPVFTSDPPPGFSWWVYQFWFNFICSAIGWTIGVLYLARYRSHTSDFTFTGADAVPLIIGLLGITGLLPRALWDFSTITGQIARKALSLPEQKEPSVNRDE